MAPAKPSGQWIESRGCRQSPGKFDFFYFLFPPSNRFSASSNDFLDAEWKNLNGFFIFFFYLKLLWPKNTKPWLFDPKHVSLADRVNFGKFDLFVCIQYTLQNNLKYLPLLILLTTLYGLFNHSWKKHKYKEALAGWNKNNWFCYLLYLCLLHYRETDRATTGRCWCVHIILSDKLTQENVFTAAEIK